MINVFALLAGLLLGFVFGLIMILNREEKIKHACVTGFVAIIVIAMGGGLYLFTVEQRDVLFQFILGAPVGFLVGLLFGGLYRHKKDRPFVGAIVAGHRRLRSIDELFHKRERERRIGAILADLSREFGKGFEEIDAEILDAISRNKRTIRGIAIFLDEDESYILERINFLKRKGVPVFQGQK